MKVSETWNQAFEQMNFDSQQGHLVREDNHLEKNNNFIFGSQELPLRAKGSSGQPSQEFSSRHQHEEEGSGRGPSKYQYSQTILGPLGEQPPKIQQSEYEEKSLRLFQVANSHQETPIRQLNFPPLPPQPHTNQHIRLQPQQPQQQLGLRQLEGYPQVTQQSYAPSQKTLVMMPHGSATSPQNSHVYHSHATTERFKSAEKAAGGPKVNIQIGSMMRREGVVKSTVHQSHIPPARQFNSQPANQVQLLRDHHYEQLTKQLQSTIAQHKTDLESARKYITHLESQNTNLKQSCDKLITEYEKKIEQTKTLKQTIARLQQQTSDKTSNNDSIKKQLEERGMLIGLLQKENQQLAYKAELCQQYQKEVQVLEDSIAMLKMELEQKDMQISQLKHKQSTLRVDHSQLAQSRALSIDNTRVMELEIQSGRLMAQMTARDEAHQQELKLCSIKFNQLAQKLNSSIAEKQHIIKILQQKNGTLESDLIKKDSLLRNLRDELVQAERKKGSPHHSHATLPPVHHSTTSSAINPPAQRSIQKAEKDESKKELDNLRKHLFDKQRQITIQNQRMEQLRQMLEQAEHTSQRRKQQLQNLKRQLTEYEDQLADYHFIKEGIIKKNSELNEMRELLLQKEEHSGQYEFLTRQNQKFKEIIIKKNNELSQLDFQLRQVEKRLRQQEGYNPQVQALEEQVQHLTSTLRSYQSQIERLNTEIQHGHERVLQAEIQLEKEQQRYNQLENQMSNYQHKAEEADLEIERVEQRYALLERELESMASKLINSQQFLEDLKKEDEVLRHEQQDYHEFTRTLQAELDSMSREHNQLKIYKVQSSKNLQQLERKHNDQLEKKNTDMHTISQKCKELETTLKNYKDRLVKIEPENQALKRKFAKHVNCQHTIKQLKNKVTLYEKNMLNSPYAKRLFDNLPQGAGRTFQNRLIYQLKNQNQSLRGNLSSQRSHSPRNEELRLRLSQLAEVMEEDTVRRVRSQQKFLSNPSQLAQSRHTNIATLKSEYSHQNYPSQTSSMSIRQLEHFYNEKVSYYRNLNSELQERNNNLVKINRQLQYTITKTSRAQLESEMKEYYTSTINFQKERNLKLQKQLKQLQKQSKEWQQKFTELQLQYKRLDSVEDVSYRYTLKGVTSDYI